MKEEGKSIFDGFETNEETGEVIIPPATVGVISAETDAAKEDGESKAGGVEYIPVQPEEEELPVLQFDFTFGEEEFADPAQESANEDMILQSIDEALAAQMAATIGPVEEQNAKVKKTMKKKNIWQRIPLWCKIAAISLCSLCLAFVLLVGTKPGRNIIYDLVGGYIWERMEYEEPTPPLQTGEPSNVTGTVADNNTQQPDTPDVTPAKTVEPRQEEYCYNILLIGVEALPQFGGSRSDTMILLSVNSETKKIYMTSLMRDMYVQIPGYADAKLNAAYSYGGASLLIDTIEQNLQVKIDGYVEVGFDSFEWIVDRLGGVEISLTAEEAEYLRTTKYITNPEYRNVVAGPQVLNGNQVLGYCRVRKVPTENGTHSDFGRTERQRAVLKKLFEKYKNSSVFTLLSVLNDCLPQVTTNISKVDMQNLLETVVENKILSLDTLRIPASGMFEDATIADAEVIIVKWAQNIELLQEFIFAKTE